MAAEAEAEAEIEAGMFDIDPPARILRLDAPQPMKAGLRITTAGFASFAAQLDRYIAARADKAASLDALIDAAVDAGCRITDVRKDGDGLVADLWFDAGSAIARIRELAQADSDLSGALDSAL